MALTNIADVERYWDRRPCNVRHGRAPVGSAAWSWEVMARKYFVEPHIPKFAEFARYAGRDVLELGCGIGTDTLSFLRAGARVDAVDISRESLSLAARRTENFPVRFFHDNVETFFSGRRYDLVYSFGVLHHTPRPQDALHLAYHALRPGGELKIMLYAKFSWKNLFTFQRPEAQAGCPLARTYTVAAARRLVRAAGFRAVLVEKAHIFPYRVKAYARHEYALAFPWWLVDPRKVEKFLGQHLLIRAVRPVGWEAS